MWQTPRALPAAAGWSRTPCRTYRDYILWHWPRSMPHVPHPRLPHRPGARLAETHMQPGGLAAEGRPAAHAPRPAEEVWRAAEGNAVVVGRPGKIPVCGPPPGAGRRRPPEQVRRRQAQVQVQEAPEYGPEPARTGCCVSGRLCRPARGPSAKSSRDIKPESTRGVYVYVTRAYPSGITAENAVMPTPGQDSPGAVLLGAACWPKLD